MIAVNKIRTNKVAKFLLISGTAVIILGASMGWGAMPHVLKMKVAESKYLLPESEGRLQFENKPIIPLIFKVYLFNVTNFMDVHKGAKPMVQEIGPYYFIEAKEKVGISDDDESDTMFYYVKNTWVFDKVSTEPLSGNEILYLPHPALLGILYQAQKDQPAFMSFVEIAVRDIFNGPNSIFFKTTVMDFLFDGIHLNCTGKGIFTIIVCGSIKKAGTLPQVRKDIYKFSIFGARNGSRESARYQVNRGTKDVASVGRVVTYDGRGELTVWGGMPCNRIAGTDATVFPPFIHKQDLDLFSTDVCRTLKATFQRLSTYKSVPTLMYSGGIGDVSADPGLKCFCSKPNKCEKQGVMDVTKCLGAPFYASLPHFFDSHEDYVNGVDGLSPNESIHGIILEFEGMSGIPMVIKKRLQYSVPIRPVKGVRLTSRLPNTILPLFWVEEGIELSDQLVAELDKKLLSVLRAVDGAKWTMTGLGAGAVTLGAILKYSRHYQPNTLVATLN